MTGEDSARPEAGRVAQLWNVLRVEMSLVADTLPADAKGTDRAPEGTRHLQAEAWHNRPGPVEGIDMSEPGKLAAKDAKYLKTSP